MDKKMRIRMRKQFEEENNMLIQREVERPPSRKPAPKPKSGASRGSGSKSGSKSRSRPSGGGMSKANRRLNNGIMGRPKKPPLIASEKTDGKSKRSILMRLNIHH